MPCTGPSFYPHMNESWVCASLIQTTIIHLHFVLQKLHNWYEIIDKVEQDSVRACKKFSMWLTASFWPQNECTWCQGKCCLIKLISWTHEIGSLKEIINKTFFFSYVHSCGDRGDKLHLFSSPIFGRCLASTHRDPWRKQLLKGLFIKLLIKR